jgi:hypothetical protein
MHFTSYNKIKKLGGVTMNYEVNIIKAASERLINEPSNKLISDFIYIITTMRKASSRGKSKKIIAKTYNAVLKAQNIDLDLKVQLRVAIALLTNGQASLIS